MNSHFRVDALLSVAGALVSATLVMALAGCHGNVGEGNSLNSIGAAEVKIALVPTGTSCIVITVAPPAPGAALNFEYAVAPQANATFSLTDLPLASDTFSARSYSASCASGVIPAASTQTYVSNSVTTSVTVAPVTVTLYMGNGTGEATVGVNFPTVSISEYSTGANSYPVGITAGPDGNLWFTESGNGSIGNITPGANPVAQVVYGPTSTAGLFSSIVAGPDGNLWFTEANASPTIVRITPAGQVEDLALPSTSTPFGDNPPPGPTPRLAQVPGAIVAGPDGNIWFAGYGLDSTENVSNPLYGFFSPSSGSISASDVFNLAPLSHGSNRPGGMAVGYDGAIWMIDGFGENIIAIFPNNSGTTSFDGPGTGQCLCSITLGPDGTMWFTAGNLIGRVNPGTSEYQTFAIPTQNSQPAGITAGPDGNVWFTENAGNNIGRITTGLDGSPMGVITEYPVPTAKSGPYGITAGPDGNIWFTEDDGGNIGRLSLF